MLCAILGQYKPKAKVNGSLLVLSLPDAVTPTVWTLDLAQDGHGALKIIDGAEGQVTLVYSTGKKAGSEIEIAHYTRRGDGVRALVAATSALENASGDAQKGIIGGIKAPQGSAAYGLTQWVLTLVGIVLLVGAFFYFTGQHGALETALSGASKASYSEPSASAAPARDQPSRDAVGVPMDANNFFYTTP